MPPINGLSSCSCNSVSHVEALQYFAARQTFSSLQKTEDKYQLLRAVLPVPYKHLLYRLDTFAELHCAGHGAQGEATAARPDTSHTSAWAQRGRRAAS